MSAQANADIFSPDLIVEVTMLCDLQCKGCYAPTLLSTVKGTKATVHLPIEKLNATINTCNIGYVNNISVRGGEPTLHPQLGDILILLKKSCANLYLETNGNWIIKGDDELLSICANTGITVKISFDSMHSLSASNLAQICEVLSLKNVCWLIAITEINDFAFRESRRLCYWASDEQIIFQRKSFRHDTLVKPRLGVIHHNGELSSQLSVKHGFLVQNDR